MTEPSRTERLAEQSAADRATRERRTALAAAFADAARNPGTVSGGLAALVRSRIDGTAATFRETGKSSTSQTTNHADGITHASTPLETNRED